MTSTNRIEPVRFKTHHDGEVRGKSPDGKVIFIFKNGDKYIGPFEGDKPKGRGTYSFANGDMFESSFDTDDSGALTIAGEVVYRWRNGDIYRGEFAISSSDPSMHGFEMTGKGIMRYAEGGQYEGDFICGLFEGKGSYLFSDGSAYRGEFRGGKMHGHGTMTYPDGTACTGEFRDDQPVTE